MKGTSVSTSSALPQVKMRVTTTKRPMPMLIATPVIIALGVDVLAFLVSSAIWASQRVIVVLSFSCDIHMCTAQSNPSSDKIKGKSAIMKAVPTEPQPVLFANWKKASRGLFLGSRIQSTKHTMTMPPMLTTAMNASKKGSHFAKQLLKR